MTRLRSERYLAWLALAAVPALAWAHPVHELKLQPALSSAHFSVRLIWFQTVHGQFNDVEGGVHVDTHDGMAHVHARIRVDSVRVHPTHFRTRLLGNHFFDARIYPYITFDSLPIRVDALRKGAHLSGHLTLHGVTRPLTLQLSDTKCSGPSLDGCTLHLDGWLNRTRYGMRAYRALVSTRVRLWLVIRLQSTTSTNPVTPTATSTAPRDVPSR